MAKPQVKVYMEDGRVISADVWSGGAWRDAEVELVLQWPEPLPPLDWDGYDQLLKGGGF